MVHVAIRLRLVIILVGLLGLPPTTAKAQVLLGDKPKEAAGGVVILDGSSAKPSNSGSEDSGCELEAMTAVAHGAALYQSSGNAQIDVSLSRELGTLRLVFRVNPFFGLYDDSSGMNAYATPPDAVHPQGTVAFGMHLMADELRRTNFTGYSIPAIMAHEFGHIVQSQNGINVTGKYRELQADYLAGWYMGNRERAANDAMDAMVTSTTNFFEKGDYSFNDRSHHGTPDERKAAVVEGFLHYKLSLQGAVGSSTQYVQSLASK